MTTWCVSPNRLVETRLPRLLNCRPARWHFTSTGPFHTLAQEYTELACGMNLRLLDGLLEGLARTGLIAQLDPTPPNSWVRLSPVKRAS